MISLLHSDPSTPASPEASADQESAEFEIVVGRPQIASISLVVVVLLAVVSGISYLIGKTVVPKAAEPVAAAVVNPPSAPVPEPAPAVAPAPPAPEAKVPDAQTTDAPLFDLPTAGQVYIQVGAVEKGIAAIWSEGLRTHGLKAFAAPGPSEKIFRVLIGPLPTPASYQHAKDVLDKIGLAMFGRRYEL
jgi:cell division septation protein DedD